MIYLIITVGVMFLDRIVKTMINGSMNPGDTISVIGDFFHITYVRNTGAAFSMLQGHTTLLIVLPAVVIALGIIYMLAMSKTYKPVFLIALALMCGGGAGNLLDRISYGYVIDMFDFGSFPVFNVADISVCVGCGMLILYLIIYENRK